MRGRKEASGDISYLLEVARYLSDDFTIWSGNDDMIVPLLSLEVLLVSFLFGLTQSKRWFMIHSSCMAPRGLPLTHPGFSFNVTNLVRPAKELIKFQ